VIGLAVVLVAPGLAGRVRVGMATTSETTGGGAGALASEP